ncbi:hypothetical protein [Candidatus Mycobacterium methanotrophicum]|uniref:Uncharacterized protein n=1 Tax=Candidatus Mycobacterium methanotrophicum TaxID=2943498 RepID=A0ABY4QPD8_9MYCO|nr:hypothetical protein [Candidatus Mycobacterium methanotrophicum]UQX11736.1 hypothetical protein M5I08_04655 [Candidatus Mycobacterium methanotrophicum]
MPSSNRSNIAALGIEKAMIGVTEDSATLALKTFPDRFMREPPQGGRLGRSLIVDRHGDGTTLTRV